MDNYRILFSGQFQKDIEELEEDFLGFGEDQTNQLISQIIQSCSNLHYFPHRFEKTTIQEREYHRLIIKSHRVFYRVFEEEKIVIVDFVVHGRQENFESKLAE
jgi:plasmid stabilization system protein ParE